MVRKVSPQLSTKQLSSGFTVAVGKLYLQEFEHREYLGEGRTGCVFQATWKGKRVALKICDLHKDPKFEDEILTEVAVYKALESLQGVCIPRLKVAGYEGGLFGIATEIAGFPVEPDRLSHRERWKIVDGLSLIHGLGIIHNDIRSYNVLVCRSKDGFQFRFIDFGSSRRTCDKRKLKKEMTQLKYLLGMDQTCGRPR